MDNPNIDEVKYSQFGSNNVQINIIINEAVQKFNCTEQSKTVIGNTLAELSTSHTVELGGALTILKKWLGETETFESFVSKISVPNFKDNFYFEISKQTNNLNVSRKIAKLRKKACGFNNAKRFDSKAQYELSLYLGSYLMGDYSENIGLSKYKSESRDYRVKIGRNSFFKSEEGVSIVPYKYGYLKKKEINYNYELAFAWLKIAADNGNVEAKVHLGRCYRYGVAYTNEEGERVQLVEQDFDAAYNTWSPLTGVHPAAGYYIWRMQFVLPENHILKAKLAECSQSCLESSSDMNYPPAVCQKENLAEEYAKKPPYTKTAQKEAKKQQKRYRRMEFQYGWRDAFGWNDVGIYIILGWFTLINIEWAVLSLIFHDWEVARNPVLMVYWGVLFVGTFGILIWKELVWKNLPNYTSTDSKKNTLLVRVLIPILLTCLVVGDLGLWVGVEISQNYDYSIEHVAYLYNGEIGEYVAEVAGTQGEVQIKDKIFGKKVTELHLNAEIDQLTIGRNIKTIVVYPNSDIDRIKVANGNPNFVCESGCVIDANGNLVFTENRTEITIPSGVTSVDKKAFLNCENLQSVIFESDSLESIGEYAFYGCSGLTSVIFESDSLESIGEYAFYGCSGLTSIIIPADVKSIGIRAFAECSNLTTVVIPKSVESIRYSFYSEFIESETYVTTVFYGGTAHDWDLILYNDRVGNRGLCNATRYYYSEAEPAVNAENTDYDGLYWHWNEDKTEPIVWVYNKEI